MAARVDAHVEHLDPLAPRRGLHDHGMARLAGVSAAAVGIEQFAETAGLVRCRVLVAVHDRVRGDGTVEGLAVVVATALRLTVGGDDTGGVLPGASGELPAHGVEMIGAEIGERRCGLPGRDRQLARVEGHATGRAGS
jgi:hypothetical protein